MAPFPVGQCANCEQDNRLLKYCRRTRCCKYACQRAAHAEVQARKASRGGGEVKEKAPPVFCFSIIEVYGQRDVDPASLVGAKRRNPLAAGEKNESYLVYGEFAESETDAGFKDVRWVELTDLLNIEDGTLSKIDEYEKKLYKRMSAKRKALIEAQEED